MSGDDTQLESLIAAEAARAAPPEIDACTAFLRDRYGETTTAILFYGAGLRNVMTPDTLLDFYVVVDRPTRALDSICAGLAANIAPPNVYSLNIPTPDGARRAKVAVIGTRAFVKGCGAFSSHLWARFAQPVVVAYVRDAAAREAMIDALANAAWTMIATTRPLMAAPFTATALWVRGLQECYAAELRPEYADRADAIVAENAARYAAVTAAVLGVPQADGDYAPVAGGGSAHVAWWFRRRWGKAANLVRLMKAAFTYSGGLDYAVAKIAKHTGVKVEISDRDRRHPLLAGIRVFLEARRRGGVR